MKQMLKNLFVRMGFMPSGSGATAIAEPAINTKRHLDIINPPAGMPSRIDWDLNDPKSLAEVKAVCEKLQNESRQFFKETAPGEAGKHLKAPDLQDDMISAPLIVAG